LYLFLTFVYIVVDTLDPRVEEDQRVLANAPRHLLPGDDPEVEHPAEDQRRRGIGAEKKPSLKRSPVKNAADLENQKWMPLVPHPR
jgi:hypothetical protein